MPVKDETTGAANLLPLQLPGISNLEICRSSYDGDLGLVRAAVEKALNEGHGPETLVNACDSSQRTALHWSVSNKHAHIVRYLLKEGKADVKLLDESGWSPLMIAASVGSVEIVELLLTALGPDGCVEMVNATNSTGQTALHYAASKNHLEIARMLLEIGANVNAADNYGNTPLHRAASKGNLDMVQLMLKSGRVNTSAIDLTGSTALHFACEEGRGEVASVLIQHGFSLETKNGDEKTPLDLAPDNLRSQLRQVQAGPTA